MDANCFICILAHKTGGDIKAGALTDDAFRSAFQRCYQLARGRDGDATVYVI